MVHTLICILFFIPSANAQKVAPKVKSPVRVIQAPAPEVRLALDNSLSKLDEALDKYLKVNDAVFSLEGKVILKSGVSKVRANVLDHYFVTKFPSCIKNEENLLFTSVPLFNYKGGEYDSLTYIPEIPLCKAKWSLGSNEKVELGECQKMKNVEIRFSKAELQSKSETKALVLFQDGQEQVIADGEATLRICPKSP